MQNVLSEVVSHLFQLTALATRGRAFWNDAAGCPERDSKIRAAEAHFGKY